MPRGKNKKFIDKSNSVTFHLVHRSQKDPLTADETAPQRVLVPINSTSSSSNIKTKAFDNKKRREEQHKYGIYFDDEYDYLQHLKDANTLPVEWARVDSTNGSNDKVTHKINLPSSVFASSVEEQIGLLNKAAPISGPQLDLDPDLVAAMDDDFHYNNPDNMLEDNFMELANAGECNETVENYESKSNISSNSIATSDEERDELCSLSNSQYTFNDEEIKSRFTEYSMSSSVINRNDQLTLLDNKFERMYTTYDDIEIGALDCDEIEGFIATNSNIILQYATEFEKQEINPMKSVSELMQSQLKLSENYNPESDEELGKIMATPNPADQWDCQSILTTYSNIYNRPKLISAPKKLRKIEINRRTGIPKDVLNSKSGKLTTKILAQHDMQDRKMENETCGESIAETTKSVLSVLSVRPKDETPNERKERKAALKHYRKERRAERKWNTLAFKKEKKHQEKLLMNDKYSKNNHIL